MRSGADRLDDNLRAELHAQLLANRQRYGNSVFLSVRLQRLGRVEKKSFGLCTLQIRRRPSLITVRQSQMITKSSRLLRLGILGSGPIAQIAHFDAAKKARNVELTAICDLADDLRERMAALHQPRFAYRDYE